MATDSGRMAKGGMMAGFLLRRLLNYLVLIVVATSLAYMLAAFALNPPVELRGP